MSDSRGHVFFFDVRNTLGVVDRPGHLLSFRPSTVDLLKTLKKLEGVRLAVITNVPASVDAREMLKAAGLEDFFEKIISTQDPEIRAANVEKPQREMYELAARAMGVGIGDCTYVSENIAEVLGAISAGMNGVVKKFPPGGDYMRSKLIRAAMGPTSSATLMEALFEEQHSVSKRIISAAMTIVAKLRQGENPSPKSALLSAVIRMVWLAHHFVDTYHHRMEEEVLIPFAHMRGYPTSRTAWILEEHEQGRSYLKAMAIALNRIQSGNRSAILEFACVTDAFVQLYKAHCMREDDESFKEIGDLLTEDDDAVMCGMLERLGPPDITIYYDMIHGMESELEVEL